MVEKIRRIFKGITLSNNQLKMIAIITMTIDHLGAYILTDYVILRIIGRITYPIFAYMIAEGCTYTKNRKKYLGVMATLAFVYQVVYFIITHSLAQCILVTFSLSIALIYIIDNALRKKDNKSKALAIASVAAAFIITEGLPSVLKSFSVDYGFCGVLVPVMVYIVKSRGDKLFMMAFMLFILAGVIGGVQWFSFLALPLLAIYSGNRGKRNLKYFFYIYYPLHLAVIYLVGIFI